MPPLEKIHELASYWRVIFVLVSAAILCFWLLGMIRLVPMTSQEKWQVPVLAAVMMIVGLYWLARQPAERDAAMAEVIAKNGKEWQDTVLMNRYRSLVPPEPQEGTQGESWPLFTLIRIPELNAGGKDQREILPRTSIMEMVGADLFVRGGTDGALIHKGEAIRHGKGLQLPIGELCNKPVIDGFLLLRYRDNPPPSNEQLIHLIEIK